MKISILGCGWLGLAIGEKLMEQGHTVKGTTTTQERISILERHKIKAFYVDLKPKEINGDIDMFLENTELLIIAIPPKLRHDSSESYIGKIQTLVPYLEKHQIENIFYISSTSVYDDSEILVTEQTKKNPITESGKQILAVEDVLRNNTNFNTTIIRFGGLINEDRNPIIQLSRSKSVEKPFGVVNLIHQKDCVKIIQTLIEKQCLNEEFNVVSSEHPSRIDYYTQKAIEKNLQIPNFNINDLSKGKIISNEKICSYLNYANFTKL